MDGDTLTVGDSTDFEEYMRESVEEASDDGGGLDNVTELVSDAWERVRTQAQGYGQLQLYEAVALALSGAVVVLHGLLGLLPISPPRQLLPLLPLLVHALLALACAYTIAYLCRVLYVCLVGRRRGGRGPEMEAKDESEVEEDGNIVSALSTQLEKEERVQRWIDNLSSDMREQINLEACGEIRGRNMEAEASCADLLGDGQAAERPTTPLALPPAPAPAPLCSPSDALGAAMEGRRALSLAYELSVAVRNQQANEIRASLSAPVPPTAYEDEGPEPARPLQDRDQWKVVSVGPQPRARGTLQLQPRPLAGQQALPLPLPPAPSKAPLQPPACNSRPSAPLPLPLPLKPPTPEASDGGRAPDALAASSLLSFVQRFRGTRFLMRDDEPAPPLSVLLEGVRRSLPVPTLEASTSVDPPAPAPEHRDSNNMMKVFSKGLLSEGAVDISTTSIQTESINKSAAADQLTGAVQVQESTRSRTTTSTSTSTERPNISSQRSRVTMDPLEGAEASWSSGSGSGSPPKTTRGLTVNMSDDGLPKRVSADSSDNEHKSLFDLRKSLLSSIPEAAPPDEDLNHL